MKKLIIFITILTAVIALFIVVGYLSQSQNLNKINKTLVSYSVELSDNSILSYSVNTDDEIINLLVPSIGKVISEKKYITFNTNSEFDVTYITEGTVLLNKGEVSIVIYLAAEGNPFGLLDTKIESKDIENLQFPNLKRYNISNIDALNETFSYINISNNYMYIYTDAINSGLDCGEQYSTYICGSEYIYFTKGYEKHAIQLMCSIKNVEDTLYCDEFISALEFNLS